MSYLNGKRDSAEDPRSRDYFRISGDPNIITGVLIRGSFPDSSGM